MNWGILFFLFTFLFCSQVIAQLDSLDLEIGNHVSSCTAESRKMKDELEEKEDHLSTVEKEADTFLKVLFMFFYVVSFCSCGMKHGQSDDLQQCDSTEF